MKTFLKNKGSISTEFINLAFIFLIVLAISSYIKNIHLLKIHYVFCETGDCSDLQSFDERFFYINSESQTVVMQEYGFLSKLEGCRILKKDNWTCVNHTQNGDDIISYRNNKYSHYPQKLEDQNQHQLSYPVWLWKKFVYSFHK